MTSPVIDVNDINFDAEVLASPVPVLVDFTAVWCGPCRALSPLVDKLAEERKGALRVVKIDLDESPGIATKYAVRAAPTLMVFEGGQRRAQHVGLLSRDKLAGFVDAAIAATV